MLSKDALPLIQASVPLLREQGENITKVFYGNMFAAHPELKNIFNAGNQATGEQQQALASAVYAYAANIENPTALAPVLNRIAHKHAAVGITPSQYTIVGKYLLAAIKEVLGDVATPEIMAAWDEAYWLLAGELIAIEAKLYFDANIKGGENWKNLTISRIEDENEYTRSLYLIPENDEVLNDFLPGQYVSVELDVPALGAKQLRQYTLSDAPYQDHWRITVKKESGNSTQNTPAGNVSNLIHNLKVGAQLKTSPAYGDFVLPEKLTKPVTLISAGVGVTPMVAMLKTIQHKAPTLQVNFLHAANDEASLSLVADVKDAKKAMPNLQCHYFLNQKVSPNSSNEISFYNGKMNISELSNDVINPDGKYLLCGPIGFMREQRKSLLAHGVSPEQISYEVFGPDLLAGLD